ncbi:MAG TPA: hypothetical protein VLL54_18740 [Pyrinomonadaceae bacterium]|nr:hypothetical protein [Pyrinomonadaceae bacterium]
MTRESDSARELLRHTVATLAYRGGKTLRDADANFIAFRADEKTRTPLEILAHIGDLLAWGLSIAQGQEKWSGAKPKGWDYEMERFFKGLKNFDEFLASEDPLACPMEKLFQGPIADALTHVGQIAMLRRLAGDPMRGENYFVAEITVGKVGVDQAEPRFEFE